jgi:hypothetical protein
MFYFSSGKSGFPLENFFRGDFLIFLLQFEISSGKFGVPLEIWIFRWRLYFPADFLNVPQIFRISSGMGFTVIGSVSDEKNGNRTDLHRSDSLERRSS